jgi:LmbE family N-acetylglucosaminyl deacetylase
MRSFFESSPGCQAFCRLEDLEIPGELHVLVLAPHPDDFDVIAVTLRRLQRAGNPIHLAVLTSGASGVEPGFCAGGDWETRCVLREHEQRRSCRHFGLPESDFEFLRLNEDRSGHMTSDEDNLERIRSVLIEQAPDLVFLPHGHDTNADHRHTYGMLRQIAAFSALKFLAFLVRDPKTIEMRDEVVTFFGPEEAEWKAELMRFHDSQQQRNLNVRGYGFDERILRLNQETAARVLRSQRRVEGSPTDGSASESDPDPEGSSGERYAESFEIEIWDSGRCARHDS